MPRTEPDPPMKTVIQEYAPDDRARTIMNKFVSMVNDAVTEGMAEGEKFTGWLPRTVYRALRQEYGLESSLVGSAVREAEGLLKARLTNLKEGRRAGRPFCHRPFLSASKGVHVRQGILDMPELIRVELAPYTLGTLGPYEVLSATLTLTHCCITYTNRAKPKQVEGLIGIDLNLGNVTMVDSGGTVTRFDTTPLVDIALKYREVQSHVTRDDQRLRKRIFRKYGRKRRNRVRSEVHKITAFLVKYAAANAYGIVLEDLKGMRGRYTKKQGGGTEYRARMNSWVYGLFLRQIEYKADWQGVVVISVKPAGTSTRCSRCGHGGVTATEDRLIHCPACGLVMDRDVNAARNILSRGMRFVPDGRLSEAVGSGSTAGSSGEASGSASENCPKTDELGI